MLSIVIPTLNAEHVLPQTLKGVQAYAWEHVEVLVVDGGSKDQTAQIAQDFHVKVIKSPVGRGRQLAAGAIHAKGPWLLFLHADTQLPIDWDLPVGKFISEERNAELAAYFRLSFDDNSSSSKRVAMLANWRAQSLGLPYGDQGLLIHRDLYDQVGGFDTEHNLMEDVDLVRRIGPMRLKPLHAEITTSAQRYRLDGWWSRPLRNITCLALYLLGARQSLIERLYR